MVYFVNPDEEQVNPLDRVGIDRAMNRILNRYPDLCDKINKLSSSDSEGEDGDPRKIEKGNCLKIENLDNPCLRNIIGKVSRIKEYTHWVPTKLVIDDFYPLPDKYVKSFIDPRIGIVDELTQEVIKNNFLVLFLPDRCLYQSYYLPSKTNLDELRYVPFPRDNSIEMRLSSEYKLTKISPNKFEKIKKIIENFSEELRKRV